jgi:outer membrane receptor protein involved in Fe transport
VNPSSTSGTRYQLYENLTYIRGRHNIKGGFSFVKALLDSIYNPGFGDFNFDGRFTGEPLADFLLGLPATFDRSQGRPTQAQRISEYAAYLQDDWRMTPKLTLSFGLRWDHYGAPYDKNGLYYMTLTQSPARLSCQTSLP